MVKPYSESIQIVPGHSERVTRIASELMDEWKDKLVSCLHSNHDIFAWLVQEVRGVSPRIIEHRLNILPGAQSAKQKKQHFGAEKDKII